MVVINEFVLVSRNARDKVQVVNASLSQEGSTFLINRSTGQYKGKMTEQPTLSIAKGKAKRSVLQQAELEFNSIISKYLDKGYKKLSTLTDKSFAELEATEMDELVPTMRSDQSGNLKPMLAQPYEKCQNSVLQKPLWLSKKLNGVRCMIKYDNELDEIVTISRGGKNYDVSTTLIVKELAPFFEQYPDLILDGEIYIHGRYLQEISGIARLGTWEPRCEKLEYWIYDIASDQMTFDERNEILIDLLTMFEDSPRIKVLKHVKTNSWAEIQMHHDKWVKEGFEGAVARKPDKVYAFGKRNSTMIKIKAYKEDSFLIIDYSEKLRDEDFCFILQTKEGQVFEAKPIGSRELKDEYLSDMDNIIGKVGDVKYFEWSKEGKPLQAIFQAVRYDLDPNDFENS